MAFSSSTIEEDSAIPSAGAASRLPSSRTIQGGEPQLINPLIVCIVAVTVPSGQKPDACPIGLSVNIPVGGGQKELVDAILEERKAGCRLMQDSVKWSEIEAVPGKIAVEKLKKDLGGQEAFNFTPFVTLQTIDTDKRTVPADLMSVAWDSPKMLERERAMIDAVASVLPKDVGAVMLGNEVDGYLIAKPDERQGYIAFLQAGRQELHRLRPDVRVGVTTMFLNLSSQAGLIASLQKDMDLVTMTYYPLTADFSVRPPSDVAGDFGQMIRFAAGRKLYVQEAGYPASELLGSSEIKQAEFVSALFDAARRHGNQMAGLCCFLMVDINDQMLKTLLDYYGLHADRFRAFLATLGLKKQDGTPRAAWKTFLSECSAYTGSG
jgi:hypothetical protein